MFRRVRRTVLFLGFALAVWALARPASAMPAGLCDDRGASAIAPPPALEVPDLAFMRARAAASCPGDEGPVRATIGPAHRVFAPFSGSSDQTLPVAMTLLTPDAGEKVDLAPRANRSLLGARLRVERPPRG
jgi:hypothetical protein